MLNTIFELLWSLLQQLLGPILGPFMRAISVRRVDDGQDR